MKHSKLVEGNRYLFYYVENKSNKNDRCFRANFIKMISNQFCDTIILDKYESENNKLSNTQWSIDLNIISNIECLSEIIEIDNVQCILPDDVLDHIDKYR
jgi:hypothetical protein